MPRENKKFFAVKQTHNLYLKNKYLTLETIMFPLGKDWEKLLRKHAAGMSYECL